MEEYIKRHIDLNKILEKRSVILLGPRMTGKSMYANKELKTPVLKWNLLSNILYYKVLQNQAL